MSLDRLDYPFSGDYNINGHTYEKADIYARTTIKYEITCNTAWLKNRAFGDFISESDINQWEAIEGSTVGDPNDNYSTWSYTLTQIKGIYLSSKNPEIRNEINETEGVDISTGVAGHALRFFAWSTEERAQANPRNTFTVLKGPTVTGYTYDPSDFPKSVPSKYEPRTIDVYVAGDDFYGRAYGYDHHYILAREYRQQFIPVCPFIPPPPPKVCMCCCPNTDVNDQLLKLILKKIGSEHLPASLPKLLTDKTKGNTKVESLAEFTAYVIKQIDALCGRYPIEIKIEDDDLTKEGNQEKSIKLPNMAETLAEIMGLLMVIRSESDATLNLAIRTLVEAGSGKPSAFLAYEYAKANAEFLGYKGEQVERKVPFSFKLGESRLDKMLVETEVKVKGWDNSDTSDLNDHLAPLLELAAMWKVANFRKTGSENIPGALLKILKGAAIRDRLRKLHICQEGAGKGDKSSLETGFRRALTIPKS